LGRKGCKFKTKTTKHKLRAIWKGAPKGKVPGKKTGRIKKSSGLGGLGKTKENHIKGDHQRPKEESRKGRGGDHAREASEKEEEKKKKREPKKAAEIHGKFDRGVTNNAGKKKP